MQDNIVVHVFCNCKTVFIKGYFLKYDIFVFIK